jgi:hypothetical protein
MSAAAVISIRMRRIMDFLRDRGATAPERAIPEAEIPYSGKWYFRRLIDHNVIRQQGDRCYLDEEMAREYRHSRRMRALYLLLLCLIIIVLGLLLKR